MRHQLRKQIKKNPKLIRSKSFIKKRLAGQLQAAGHDSPARRRTRPATRTTPRSTWARPLVSVRLTSVVRSAAEIVFHDSLRRRRPGQRRHQHPAVRHEAADLDVDSAAVEHRRRRGRHQLGLDAAEGRRLLRRSADRAGSCPGCGDIHNGSPDENAIGNVGFGVGALDCDGRPLAGWPRTPGCADLPGPRDVRLPWHAAWFRSRLTSTERQHHCRQLDRCDPGEQGPGQQQQRRWQPGAVPVHRSVGAGRLHAAAVARRTRCSAPTP